MQVGNKYPRGSGCSVPDVVKLLFLILLVNNFLSIRIFQDPQGGSRGQIRAGLCKLKKNILGAQAAVFLMVLSKNLLLTTLGSQITKDFVWKSKTDIHS